MKLTSGDEEMLKALDFAASAIWAKSHGCICSALIRYENEKGTDAAHIASTRLCKYISGMLGRGVYLEGFVSEKLGIAIPHFEYCDTSQAIAARLAWIAYMQAKIRYEC